MNDAIIDTWDSMNTYIETLPIKIDRIKSSLKDATKEKPPRWNISPKKYTKG